MDGFWLRKRLMLCCLICTVILQTLVSETADITLADAAARTGTDLYWDPLTGSGIFSKNGHQVAFRVGQQLMLLDYTRIAVTDPPVMSDGTAYVTEQFVADAAALFDVNLPESFYRVGAILIDPGHGGKDPGTIGTYKKNGKEITLYEKDIALSVSNKLADQLRNAYPDKKIIMTRSDDTWLSLEQRVDIANSIQLEPHEAIIYISVHVNASLNKTASGYEVWYLTPDYRRTVLDSSNIDADDEALIPILNSMLEEEYGELQYALVKYEILLKARYFKNNLIFGMFFWEKQIFFIKANHIPYYIYKYEENNYRNRRFFLVREKHYGQRLGPQYRICLH